MGAMKARGEVLCFIDDDASLDFGRLLPILRGVQSDDRLYVYHDQPHLLVINASGYKCEVIQRGGRLR